MTGPASFRFLNVERSLTAPACWNHADWPKLWLYNAHYFDDLAASGAPQRRAWHEQLIARWVAENPPPTGNGWEPYPTSLRIVNWVKWVLQGNALDRAACHSLAVQARWLAGRLEHHLLGNHLWANAKALVFAGTFFEGAQAQHLREKGLKLVRRELAEQILPDGGHFERSPMYHAIVLEDVLDLVQLAHLYPGIFAERDVDAWRKTAARMLRALALMTHPDGQIAFFNDAAFRIAPALAALAAYGHALDIPTPPEPSVPLQALADTGYMRLEVGPACLIADVAPVGSDYIPGHAHADTLSFEWSLHGRRIFVNGGTSTYEAGSERMRQRSTPMHNTVCVDGHDSTQVWGGFRVARRARPFDLQAGREGEAVWLSAAHDGYRRLPGEVTHRRTWSLDTQKLRVADALQGRFTSAVARFRLHPALHVTFLEPCSGVIEGEGTRIEWVGRGGGTARLLEETWHPEFGLTLSCQVLEIRFQGPELQVEFKWA